MFPHLLLFLKPTLPWQHFFFEAGLLVLTLWSPRWCHHSLTYFCFYYESFSCSLTKSSPLCLTISNCTFYWLMDIFSVLYKWPVPPPNAQMFLKRYLSYLNSFQPKRMEKKKRKEILARCSLFFFFFFYYSEHVISLRGESMVSSYA